MTSLKTLRTELGLSQSAFADLLNCSPGQLSMAESGLRSLPPESLAIVAQFQKALTNKKATKRVANTLNEKTVAFLNKHIRKCGVQMEAMEIAAEKLSQKLEALKRMLALSAAFATVPTTADISDVQLQMTVLQRKTAKKVIGYEDKLTRLQLSIAGLQGEIAQATEPTTY